MPPSATQKRAAPRLTNDIGRTSSRLEARMFFWIILIVAIGVLLYTQRERLSNFRR